MESPGDLIHYVRAGGRTPPRDRERLAIFKDGTFWMWRSVSVASQPVTPVGRFAGRLPGPLHQALLRLTETAEKAGPVSLTPPPDASIETLRLGGVQARLGAHQEPPGPWGELVSLLRRALSELAGQPVSAVDLVVSADAQAARLVHLGAEPIRLDLSSLQVRAVLWKGFRKEGDWRLAGRDPALPGQVEAAPGWSFNLPFNHGLALSPGRTIAAYVIFTLFDGKQPVQVSLEARSEARLETMGVE